MKGYLSAIIVASGLFVYTDGFAQMPMRNMGYNRSGMNRTASMDRGIGMNQYSNGKRKKDTSKADQIENALSHLEKELGLDSFQLAVIKDLLEKNQVQETVILEENIPDDLKYQKIMVLREELHEKIKPILSKDQIDLFAKMKDNSSKRKS